MSLGRRILCTALLAALGACSRQSTPPSTAAAAPPAAAAAAAPDMAQGAGPRLVMSPDNVHIEYQVFGQGETAVILIHGWACDANYWNMQFDALKAQYTVVAVNLAGHGGSSANRSDWSIANYAADVAAVAKQIPNAHIVLVGHSMGATVALAATPAHRAAGQRDRGGGCPALGGAAAAGGPRDRHAPGPVPRGLRRRDPQARHRLVVSARRGTRPWCRRSPTTCRSSRPPWAVPSLQALLSVDLTPAGGGDPRAGLRHQLRPRPD